MTITKRNWPADIATDRQAYAWFLGLMIEEGINIHPDTPAADYINTGDGVASYTPERAKQFDRLMESCFAACPDVYATSCKAAEQFLQAQSFRSKHFPNTASVLLVADGCTTPVLAGLEKETADALAKSLREIALRALLDSARRLAAQEAAHV